MNRNGSARRRRPEQRGLRRPFVEATKASILDKQTGNLRAAQILLDRTRIESAVRYLGVDVEDAPAVSEAVDI